MENEQVNFDFTVSAPGKIILFGEHSVVYKKAAVSTSISRRLYISIRSSIKNVICVNFPQINTKFSCGLEQFETIRKEKCPLLSMGTELIFDNPEKIDQNKYVESLKNNLEYLGLNTNDMQEKNKAAVLGFLFVFRGMCNSLTNKLAPFTLEVKSDLEVGAGTGSSAAFAVALSGSIFQYVKTLYCKNLEVVSSSSSIDNVLVKSQHQESGFAINERKIINRWAFCVEKIMHGRPSGIDNTTCTFGSVVVTSQNKNPGELSFNVLEYIPKITILLISTGVSRNTANQVLKVKQLRDNNCSAVDAILNAMDVIAQEAFKTLEALGCSNSDSCTATSSIDLYKNLSALMELNHGLLRTLGVSHKSLEHIVNVSNHHGLSCKLTGAGGGGYAIALVPPNFSKDQMESLKNELEPEFKVTEIKIAEEGIRLENL